MTPGLMLPRFSDIFGDRGIHQPGVFQWTKVFWRKVLGTVHLGLEKKRNDFDSCHHRFILHQHHGNLIKYVFPSIYPWIEIPRKKVEKQSSTEFFEKKRLGQSRWSRKGVLSGNIHSVCWISISLLASSFFLWDDCSAQRCFQREWCTSTVVLTFVPGGWSVDDSRAPFVVFQSWRRWFLFFVFSWSSL